MEIESTSTGWKKLISERPTAIVVCQQDMRKYVFDLENYVDKLERKVAEYEDLINDFNINQVKTKVCTISLK